MTKKVDRQTRTRQSWATVLAALLFALAAVISARAELLTAVRGR